MFHRNRNTSNNPDDYNNQPQQRQSRGGFFHRGSRNQQQGFNSTAERTLSYGPGYGQDPYGYPNQSGYSNQPWYRDPYHQGSTMSDWDHYAVRHQEALVGDPLPIFNNNLNLAANRYDNGQGAGPYGNGPLANGPVNSGYDDRHYQGKRQAPPNNFDRNGNPLIGPVTANGPLAGNYSSGTVVERNLVQGVGKGRTRTGWVDDANNGQQWGSTAWGSAPLNGPGSYGPGYSQGGWGNEPLYGYRDARTMATPLLPDNPWTHNEMGRDYQDGYRRGTIPYSSVNNAFTAPAVTEQFTSYGPNGERIEGTRTRVIREEIVPPVNGLGQQSTNSTTTVVKDKITTVPVSQPMVQPQSFNVQSQGVNVHDGVLVEDRVTPLPSGGALMTETKTPVTVIEQRI